MTYVISIGLNIGLKPMTQGQRTSFIDKTNEAIIAHATQVYTSRALGQGEWTQDDGSTLIEESCTWTIEIENPAIAQELADKLAPLTREFEQDSIIMMTVSQSNFISA